MVYGTQDFAQLLKSIIKDGYRHDLYELSVKHAEEMSVHINGDKPIYLLERNRPREEEEVKVYRLENHEPTTKAGADKSIKIVCKGFNPTLYSIVWKEPTPEGEELQSYTLEEYPGCNSIINFNKDVLLRKMLADANGLVAVKTEDVPDDDTDELQPIIVVYGSPAVFFYDSEHYLICVKEYEEEKLVEGKNTKEKAKIYEFEYYDRNYYRMFEAWYDGSNKQVVVTDITEYKHSIGKIPVWFTGGESKNLDNGKILYQSYFSAALPHWNLAVKHGSDLMASIINNVYPQKYEVAEECAYSQEIGGVSYSCRGGQIKSRDSKGEIISMPCPQCNGNGLVSVRGPFQQYLWNKEKLSTENGPLGLEPSGYITVPIDTTEFLDEYTDKMHQQALSAINMDIEGKVGANQSGEAKAIDRTAQNDTIYDIHSRIWDVHTNNEYFFINAYKNKVKAKSVGKEESVFLPEVNKPTKFELLTTSELIFNFNVSKSAGLDRNILRQQAVSIIKSENGSTPAMKDYLTSVIELDPLYAFTTDEIDLGVSKGVIRKVDWAIHDNIKRFIDRAIAEDKNFLSKKKQDQIIVLENYGNELIVSEKPRVDEDAMVLSFESNQDKDAA